MDRSSSKEDIDSISVHSMHRQPEAVSMSDLRQRENISLAEHIRSHPSIKVLTHQKIKTLKQYMEDSQTNRGSKQLKTLCRNFLDRCLSPAREALIDKTHKQFFIFLRNQKRSDDQKLRKLSQLMQNWQETRTKQQKWELPMHKYFQQEKRRNNNKKIW